MRAQFLGQEQRAGVEKVVSQQQEVAEERREQVSWPGSTNC